MTEKATARAAEFFSDRQTRAGFIARRLLGTATDGEDVLADHVVREIRQHSRMDGSTDGSLVKTAWSLIELIQLDCPPDHTAVLRVAGWLLSRQNQPGRFGEGCNEERHSRGLCQHFLGGLFSLGSSNDSLAPITFPNGVVVHDESHARFAASCLALRAVLRARQERRQTVIDHVGSLMNLGEVWGGWGGLWPADVVLIALGALANAPIEYRDRVERLAVPVVKRQRKDGGWDGADLLNVLEVLLAIPSDLTRQAVRAARARLNAVIEEEALFTEPANEERSLIALRALVSVQ